MLSYPAQMNVYFSLRLKKGKAGDVPESVLDSLEEMGWLPGGALGFSYAPPKNNLFSLWPRIENRQEALAPCP